VDLQQKATEILLDYMEQRRQWEDVDFFSGERTSREIELGVVVAVDPRSGEVLAMVNIPAYDNNRFVTEIPVDYYLQLVRNEYEPFLNHAIAGQYPPGSTYKIITVAAALQEGIVSPNRRLETPGTITIANQFAPNDPGRAQEFVCWISLAPNFGDHSSMDAVEGLAQSCDIYMYKITGGFPEDNIQGLGINTLADYSTQFGLGQIQGIELPLEAPGNMPNREWKQVNFGEPWSTGDDYNSSIGQGFLTSTPLQVAQMAAVIANGGFLYRPRIVHHMTDGDGNVFGLNANLDPVPAAEAQIPIADDGTVGFVPEVLNVLDVDREYIDIVAEGMRVVNTLEGTGTSYIYYEDEDFERYADWLQDDNIVTAGKTGTSEFCDNLSQIKGWCTEELILNGEVLPTHSWFVGYAPFEEAEIAISAFMYYGGEGSQWSAPIVRDLMAYYFSASEFEGNGLAEDRARRLQIPIDEPEDGGVPELPDGLPPLDPAAPIDLPPGDNNTN
ncbi:MAG: penicillin-binding transpeptidase domain-containing protein, partial [Chloroflexota bacterium]